MNFRHLRYFVAAFEHGSFRKAGAALGVQGSTISRRIRDMEDGLGSALFHRHSGGVCLTVAGQRLLSKARKILRYVNEGAEIVDAVGRAKEGHLRVGIFTSLASGFLPDLLRGFAEEHPGVHIEIADGNPAEHVAAIRQFRLDIAFLTGTLDWPLCEMDYLWSERVFVVLPEHEARKSAGQALVTNRLRGQFAIEVNKLGVAGLAIELQQAKTSAGVPFFQVRLINKPSEPVGKVLSEGEHRCVALAAFMAELSTIDAQSAIVFDDPVSSLDHLHRDKVAARLAEAGLTRQVIVFTHDMAFLLLLDEACRATKDREATPVAYRLISRGADNAGYCHQEPPASVMPLDKVIEGMKAHLANVKIHHERGDQAKWLREVTSFQDQLRTTWERAVEEVVGPVIRRLSRKVDTTGLIKLTVLTDADCMVMRQAFGRCSALLHSQPGEINPRLPAPALIGDEIDVLEKWIADVRTRQDKAA